MMTKDINASSLAKNFKISKWDIEQQNKNKKEFKKGEWVFIPKKWGFANKSMNTTQMHKYFSTGDFMWPVPSSKKVSSGFGRRWGKQHEGIDIAARRGSFIISVKAGQIVFSNWINGYGKVVVIGHSDGVFSVYAHSQTIYVKKGQMVSKGEVIAKVGSTGRSTGPHLHFELRYNSKPLNPLKFFANR